MSRYRNGCTCERCNTRGMMFPALLITLGTLLLLSETHILNFGYTWPVLFIVAGVVKVLQSNASTQGHVEAYMAYPYPVATPPAPPATPDQGQVSHG